MPSNEELAARVAAHEIVLQVLSTVLAEMGQQAEMTRQFDELLPTAPTEVRVVLREMRPKLCIP